VATYFVLYTSRAPDVGTLPGSAWGVRLLGLAQVWSKTDDALRTIHPEST
jgi:hypothetical protein